MKVSHCIFIFTLLFHFNVHADTNMNIAKTFAIESKILEEKRTIIVSLPEGYDSSKARYPVIFLLDGLQNIKHVIGSRDVLTRAGSMPKSIIVGIKSEIRMRDFTPSSVADVKVSGGGEKFLKFLESELIPFVDSQYRTNKYRVLEGHSMAGLFTAYTFLAKPELFSAYIVMSPALWWNKEELTSKVKPFLDSNLGLDKSVFFGIGVEDGYGMKQELKRFVAELENSPGNKIRWLHKEFDGEGHMSAPLLINYYALKFIFSDMQLPEHILDNYSDSKFLAHEEKIIEKYGRSTRQSQEIYVPLAMKLMEQNNYEGAITVFQRNAQAYEENKYPPNYAWLAEAYEKNKDTSKALSNYKKAYDLSINTGYGEAKKYLSKVEELEASLSSSDSP